MFFGLRVSVSKKSSPPAAHRLRVLALPSHISDRDDGKLRLYNVTKYVESLQQK